MDRHLLSLIGIFVFVFTFMHISQADELEQAIDAHGGIETFRSYGTLEYNQNMVVAEKLNLNDHQVIDLNSRKAFISSDDYKLGFDGQDAWIEPNMEALAVPPRFYASTPFYFFGLPFLFADPGVNTESLGTKELNGKEYNVVKFTYDQGVGDTPDDNYIAYFDNDTNRLGLVTYIITYPVLMNDMTKEELPRRAAVYEKWQEVDGLTVPKKITFYNWEDDNLGAEPIGHIEYENVTFKEESPEPGVFQKPEDAVVDNSHIAK